MNRKVSIIIPVYNAEKYLKRCLDSIINQSYQELQIILIDDGSSDASKDICDEYALRDKRICAKHICNSGVSFARNIGIECASGEYLTFVDSDDWLEEDAIMQMVELCESKKAQMVAFSRYEEHITQNCVDEYLLQNKDFSITNEMERLRVILQHYLQNEMFCEVWNHLYLTRIIKENEITFCKDLKYGEDKLFNLLYLLFVKEISTSNEKTYHYSIYDSSTMGEDRNKFFLFSDTYLRIAYELNNYAIKRNISNELFDNFCLIYVGLMHQVYYQKNIKDLFETFHGLLCNNANSKFFQEFCNDALQKKKLIKKYYNIPNQCKEHMGDQIIRETYLSIKARNYFEFCILNFLLKIRKKIESLFK